MAGGAGRSSVGSMRAANRGGGDPDGLAGEAGRSAVGSMRAANRGGGDPDGLAGEAGRSAVGSMRASVVGLVFVVGCWTTSSPPREPIEPPPQFIAVRPISLKRTPSRCENAIDHALELARPELEAIAIMKERLGLIRDAVVESCEVMQWSNDSLACFEDATVLGEMRNCQSSLTSEQTSDLSKRMSDVLTKPVP